MVVATVNTEEVEVKKLKSVDGGEVTLRRLTYGQKLHRRAMVSKMRVEATKGKKEFAGELDLINERATQYDFAHCIADHNLTDPQDRKLNFANINDIAQLDPRVGEEIDNLISEMNNFEEEDDGFLED